MLSKLYIENVAVIERCEIDFHAGLTVFTGETGAGKSILIDAISAVLGERTSKDIVRNGETKAVIVAQFSEPCSAAIKVLAELGFDMEDALGEMILQREIWADGRSVCRLNSRPVTASVLREIGLSLINIHGQHDGQVLLHSEKHLSILDAYAGLSDKLSDYRESYRQLVEAKKESESLSTGEREKQRELEFLQFERKEIGEAALEEGEEACLLAKRRQYRNFEKLVESVSEALAALNSGDMEMGGCDRVAAAMKSMESVAQLDETLSGLSGRLSDVYYELRDIAAELEDYLSSMEFDPSEQAAVEERLDLLFRLKRKYGGSYEEIMTYYEEITKKASAIEYADERLAELQGMISKLMNETSGKAMRLSEIRAAAAKELSQKIQTELAYLDMPSVRFETALRTKEIGPNGADEAEFLISTNPGEPPRSIAKIASGGELSRIMLAVKNVLSDSDGVDVLIFDEIDTGISGRASGKVGGKLRTISEGRQVICVTHQAQIAAFADHQLFISKSVKGGRTFTSVQELDREGRKKELARLIGGNADSDAVLKSAEELLQRAAQ